MGKKQPSRPTVLKSTTSTSTTTPSTISATISTFSPTTKANITRSTPNITSTNNSITTNITTRINNNVNGGLGLGSSSHTVGKGRWKALVLGRLSAPDRQIPLAPVHIAKISDIKFYGDTGMVSADVFGRLAVWNYFKPQASPCLVWTGHDDAINGIATSEGFGDCFVTAGNDAVLRLWDGGQASQQLQGSSLIHTFEGHTSFVQSCDVASTSSLIASVSLDSTLRLWHPSTPNFVFRAPLPVPATSVRFVSGESTLLITSGADGVFLWDIRRHPSFQLLVAPPSPAPYHDPVWGTTPTNTRTQSNNTTPTTNALQSPYTPARRPTLSRFMTPSNFITPVHRSHARVNNDDSEELYPFWQNVDYSSQRDSSKTQRGNEKMVPAAQLHSNNKAINQKKFDKSSQRYIQLFSAHAIPAYSAISSHTGRHAVTASKDNSLKLWDLYSQKGLFSFNGSCLESTTIPCLSSDDKTLICGSSTGSIHFWDALSGADEAADNSMGCAPTHSHPITCVALSSDDVTIASGDECGNIRLRTASNCILSEYFLWEPYCHFWLAALSDAAIDAKQTACDLLAVLSTKFGPHEVDREKDSYTNPYTSLAKLQTMFESHAASALFSYLLQQNIISPVPGLVSQYPTYLLAKRIVILLTCWVSAP